MDITVTRIAKENAEYFEPLMPGISIDNYELCVGAIVDDTACGACVFDFLGGALILNHIYVSEKFRRNGIATTMIRHVKDLADNMGELPIHVNYCESADDLHGLFSALGFLQFRDGKAFRVPVESFISSKAFSDMMKLKGKNRVKDFSELLNREKAKLRDALNAEDGDPDIVDDTTLSKKISFLAINENDGSPEACLLCRDNGDTIVILYMSIFKKDATALIDIIRRLKDEISGSKDMEKCEILFLTMDKKVEAFARKMVDDESMLISEGNMISAILP